MAAPSPSHVETAISQAAKRFRATDASRHKAIAVDLLQQQVCPWCVMRLMGHSSYQDYSQPLPHVQQLIKALSGSPDVAISGDSADTMTPQEASCPVCLGILQMLSSRLYGSSTDPAAHASLTAQDAATAISALGCDLSNFGVEVCLPPGTAAREARLQAYLLQQPGGKQLFPRWQASDVTSLSKVARSMVAAAVRPVLSKPYSESANADVTLSIMFEHQDSLPEVQAVIQDMLKMKQRREQPMEQQPRSKRQKHADEVPDDSAGPTTTAVPSGANTTQSSSQQQTPGQPQNDTDADHPVTPDAVSSPGIEEIRAHLAGMPLHILAKLMPWPPQHSTRCASCQSVRAYRAPLLIAGRYLKLRRNMPQTAWHDQKTGQRIGGVSLAEYVAEQLLPLYDARGYKFMSGGREDSDVRMLGEGRPFVMEIQQATKSHPKEEELRVVEQRLLDSGCGAQVKYLKPCSKEALERLKEAEETKEKTYQALCWSSQPIGELEVSRLMAVQHKVILQDTPVRVLQRRAPKVRGKHVTVLGVDVIPSNPQYFNLRLLTQAGTYIKEFCHGDFGRTQPSVADILTGDDGSAPPRVEILQLDVLAVHMDAWP